MTTITITGGTTSETVAITMVYVRLENRANRNYLREQHY
jgi:hypothetical protein